MEKKMVLLGIDGASYDLIRKFILEGRMPNFKKLYMSGSLNALESTIPPHTAPGWATAFTGVGPGQHGIYQFWDTQSADYEGEFMGSGHFSKAPVWNLLNSYGIKTGIVNVPMTHPPQKVDGYMISWPLFNTLRYCEPPELLIGIAKNKGHFASDYTTMYDGSMDYIDRAIEYTRKRLITFEFLMKSSEWDISIHVFSEVDRVSHFYWQYMDIESPEYDGTVDKKYRDAVLDIYMEVDRVLGRVLELLDEEMFFMILSDHGFGRGELNYYIHEYFVQQSLMKLKPASENETSNGEELHENNWFETVIDQKKYNVDWKNTVAYMAAPGSYGININLKGRQSYGIVEEKDYETYRDLLIEKITGITHPATGAVLFPKVLRREEVYSGGQALNAPDLIVIPDHYGIMLHHAFRDGALTGSPEQKGMHRSRGIIGITGTGYTRSDKFSSASLLDITPTILQYFGIPVPEYMEGKSLCNFEDTKVRAKLRDAENSAVETKMAALSETEKKEAKERLRALGYL